MNNRALQQWVEQMLGAGAADCIGYLSPRAVRAHRHRYQQRPACLCDLTLLRWLPVRVERHRRTVLSFCGPLILVLLVLMWTLHIPSIA